MIMMALILFVIVVSYLLMLGLVKFAEGVIDKALPGRLRDAATRRRHRRQPETPNVWVRGANGRCQPKLAPPILRP
jgi:hypothetical protein